MAKRKLTAKLKQQIKESPYRLRQADYSGEALEYLHRVRGARKAVKTKEQKAKYKAPTKAREAAPATVSDLINVAAKARGMSPKAFRKKYKSEVQEFETTGKLFYNREADLLAQDAKFLPKGRGIYINGKRVTRPKAVFNISRFKHRALQSGLVYERINIEHYYDAKGNLHLSIPTIKEINEFEDDSEALDHIQDSYPISFYRK